ncbi:Uncharacterised protein [Klebsiella oxytoca]|nr:Uncharacterised protein [Klebsiella oxytoca]SAQ30635.1 Uncharacterised protein [Klebsiella oxytoca]
MSKKLGNTFTIRQIDFMETEQGGLQQIQPGLLQIDIIVIVHVVESDNLMTRLQKAFARMKTDESCGSSH